MKPVVSKSLYLFLCSILGMVLFAMLQRAIFVLYDLVLVFDFQTFSFGLTESAISQVDLLTMLFALFLGGWYGIALGLEWHASIYGLGDSSETKSVGLFHGFVPSKWGEDKKKSKEVSQDQSYSSLFNSVEKTVTIKPVVKKSSRTSSANKPSMKPVLKSVQTNTMSESSSMSTNAHGADLSFEEFLKATPAPKKRATSVSTKSSVASKKAVRKSTAKKVTKTAKIE